MTPPPPGGRANLRLFGGGRLDRHRTIRPGDLFVALRNPRDGHDFVAQALERAAAPRWSARIPEAWRPMRRCWSSPTC